MLCVQAPRFCNLLTIILFSTVLVRATSYSVDSLGNRVTSGKATLENGEVKLAGTLGFSSKNGSEDLDMVTQTKHTRGVAV